MKVMSFNIQFSTGLDGMQDLKRTCDVIRGADIICLQEVEQGWTRTIDSDQPADISTLLPEYYTVYGSSFDVDESYKLDNGNVVNRRRRHGNMVLSRWPILSSRTFNLPKLHYDNYFNMQMTFVEAVVDVEPRPLRVYSYHAGYLDSPERIAQVESFARIFNASPGEKGAWSGKIDIDGQDWSNHKPEPPMPESAIVCGDFNCNFTSEEYRILLAQTGLIDCWDLKDCHNKSISTIKHTPLEDVSVSGKIDQIFVTPDLADGIISAGIDVAADASDHCPIHIELELPEQ